jgi:hypothetical protein
MFLLLIVLALGAGVTFYFAVNNSPGPSAPVPNVQGEGQVMGLNVESPFDVSVGIDAKAAGSNVQHHPHFWIPGLDPVPGATPCNQYTPHRYPAIPGGNISTVMHQGIVAACCNNAPADNDWRLNPPEAAVL